MTPIRWQSSDGKRFVAVNAGTAFGMATICDMDVLIWAVSQINDAVNAGRQVSRVLHFDPHDMLKSIGRGVGGDNYDVLKTSLNRVMRIFTHGRGQLNPSPNFRATFGK